MDGGREEAMTSIRAIFQGETRVSEISVLGYFIFRMWRYISEI